MFQKYYELNTFNYFEEFNRYKRINFNNKRKDNPIYNEVILDEFGNNLSDFDDVIIYILHQELKQVVMQQGMMTMQNLIIIKEQKHIHQVEYQMHILKDRLNSWN